MGLFAFFLKQYKVFPGVFFGPILEPKGEDAFIEERPEVLYAQNKVPPIPWVHGFLADEGNAVGFRMKNIFWPDKLLPILITDKNSSHIF
jgi:hypothetical protein